MGRACLIDVLPTALLPNVIVAYRFHLMSRVCDNRSRTSWDSTVKAHDYLPGGPRLNTMGCSFAVLTLAALAVSLIPVLGWTVYAVALPMSAFGVFHSFRANRQPTAQDADRAMLWVSLGLLGLAIFRTVVL